MDENRINSSEFEEETENSEILIRECLKKNLSEDVYNTWIENFVFEEINSDCVTVSYYGDEPIKDFNKNHKEEVWILICSVIGYTKKFKVNKKTKEKISGDFKPEKKKKPEHSENFSPKAKKNIKTAKLLVISLIFVFFALAIGLMATNYIGNRNFRETFYSVSSLKNDNSIRVIQISDLHNCNFGKNNAKLISRVKKLNPDIVVLTGDIIDSKKRRIESTVNLGNALSKIAPTYYIYGNNEAEIVYDFALSRDSIDAKFGFNDKNRDPEKLYNYTDKIEKQLEAAGVKVLKDEMDTLTVGSTPIDIYGVLTSNPSSFYLYAGASFEKFVNENPANLKIIAFHEPFVPEIYRDTFFGDLILCGHTHGGTIRVPMLGPLYTNEGGILPERNDSFVYGVYSYGGMPLIVSAGMENSNILRINNQPELVIVDINKF